MNYTFIMLCISIFFYVKCSNQLYIGSSIDGLISVILILSFSTIGLTVLSFALVLPHFIIKRSLLQLSHNILLFLLSLSVFLLFAFILVIGKSYGQHA